MRSLTALAVGVSGATLLALGSLAWPVLGWPAAALAVLATLFAWGEWWLRRRERQALERALGLLAEFRLPLPNDVHRRLPPVLRQVVGGYEALTAEMQRREAELTERVQRYAFMELHTEDILTQVDAQGLVKYASPALKTQLGFTPQEMLGQRIMDLLHPEHQAHWLEQLKASARERRSVLLEGLWRHKDGHYVTLEMLACHAYGLNGAVVETISMARNVEARNALREQLTRAAQTDHLTGLPNRAALVTALERFRAGSRERPFVLCLFDLDRFKQVNDSLGHAAGDQYLLEAASRVRAILRPADTLARMGGDEFVALFEGLHDEAAAKSIAARMLEALGQPFVCEGVLLHPKASIGIVVCDQPEIPADELIMRADRAMYEAKRQGGNLAIVYDGREGTGLRKAFDMEQVLTLALQQRRFLLHFQPIVDARQKHPILAEALVRLRGEDGRLVPPMDFIEIAEQTGQIVLIGRQVLEQACWHVRRLEEAGLPSSVSVNVSPRQLLHVNFVPSVEAVLEDTGVSPSSIVLEVTESAVMEDLDKAKATLLHLKSLGFRLALDDFGTGYSSISMLHQLPFDILKIDRAFVRDMHHVGEGPSTLGAIIDIGKALQLTIIGEGVETAEQALALERLGCDLLQGFRFHRPMEAEAHAQMLQARQHPTLTLVANAGR